MGSTAVTNDRIWPSQNDVNGGVSGEGKTWLELAHRLMNLSIKNENSLISGGALVTSATLVEPVPSGEAYIDGRYVSWPATNVTLPASSTSHLFVKVVKSAGLVTGVEIEDNTSGTPPADSVKLGTATTSGSAITSVTDQRLLSRNKILPRLSRTIASDTWRCPEGITEALVHVRGAGGGGGGGGGGKNVGASDAGEPGDTGLPGLPGEDVWRIVTVTPGTNYTRTVGTGGAGGSGGANGSPGANGANGSDGGASTFGALASAAGGRRGIGGRGGAVSSATFTFPSAVGLSTTNGDGEGQPGLGGGGGNGGSGGAGSSGVAGGNGKDGFIETYY